MPDRRSLLLIVDIQRGFMNEHTRPVVPTINKLVKHWEEQGLPVVCSRFVNLPKSNWQRLRNWHELEYEPATLLAEDLKTNTPYIFKKGTYSAWSHEVAAVCLAEQATDVYIVGVDTNECVLATAISVFDDGFTPWIIEDATASSGGPEVRDTALVLLRALMGEQQVISAKELL